MVHIASKYAYIAFGGPGTRDFLVAFLRDNCHSSYYYYTVYSNRRKEIVCSDFSMCSDRPPTNSNFYGKTFVL